MKKLLFVLAFAFIGQQAFSQMYIVTLGSPSTSHPSCPINSSGDAVMTTVDPQGNITYDCMPNYGQLIFGGSNIALLNQKFNSILSQGYKLVATDTDNNITTPSSSFNAEGAWYFAIP